MPEAVATALSCIENRPAPESLFPGTTATRNPSHIWIEPTTRCNTRCRHCEHFHGQFGQDMDEGLSRKIIDSVLDEVERAELVGYGEPLIAGCYDALLDECVCRGIEVLTTTNGLLLLQSDVVSKLVRSNVQLSLSIDGARAETFEFVRSHVGWSRMLDILASIKRAVAEAGDETGFRLRFSSVVTKKTIGDLPDLVRLGAEYGVANIFVLPLRGEDEFEHMKDQSLSDSPDQVSPAFLSAISLADKAGIDLTVPPAFTNLILDGKERGRGLRGRIARWLRIGRLGFRALRRGELLPTVRKHWKRRRTRSHPRIRDCGMPWNDSYFAVDGQVYSCCFGGDPLGNLKQQTWSEIWNGPRYRHLRRAIHSLNPPHICKTCVIPQGINGGDERGFQKYFEQFRDTPLSLTSPDVEFSGGFHGVEVVENSTPPSHCWMGRTGRISLPMQPGAKFLRLAIFGLCPAPEPNPGWCRVNGGPPEPFDNVGPHIHLPIRHIRESRLVLDLEMERAYQVPGDDRDLGLDIFGMHYLR